MAAGAVRRAHHLLACVALLVAAGCATQPPLYTWGSYEELLYTAYTKPGEALPEQQVTQLEADYQKARADNRRMPPGWHAYLGYLYFSLGRLDQAMQQLQTEKAEYPESTVFVDRLLTRLTKS